MGNIIFRMAKPCDAKALANLHWNVRERYSKGIFLLLGKSFLKTYYQIILNDPYEIVVCAEDCDSGQLIGFSSATLKAEHQAGTLKKHRFRLGLSATAALIRKPILIKDLWQRYKSIDGGHGQKFINTHGVRGEYWCWLKNEEDVLDAIEMGYIKEDIISRLGYKELFFEVDKFNKRVFKFYSKFEKCEVIEEITLPDGRERVLFKKDLSKIKKRIVE